MGPRLACIALAGLLGGCGAGDSGNAAPPVEQPASAELSAAVDRALTVAGSEGRDSAAVARLRTVYRDEVDGLVWFTNAVPRPALDSLLAVLDGAVAQGLDPERFGRSRLRQARQQLDSAGGATPVRLASLDVAASTSALGLLRALASGQVDPRTVGFAFDPAGRDVDVVGLMLRGRDAGSFRTVVDSVLPRLPVYRRLVAALAEYRELADRAPTWPSLPGLATGQRVTVGDTWPGLAALRTRLVAWGDLVADSGASARYDSLTAQAVRRFQARHGLAADGVIGAGTLAELDVPIGHRIAQLELALERSRWFPRLPPGRAVVVTLPFYELDAYEDIQQPPAFSMRVVIGERGLHATPIFADSIAELVFRPYWNIPATLAAREIVDTAKTDSTYLSANQYEIIRRYSDSALALPVTPERLDSVKAGTLFLRQRPGPLNALGRVKFLFPNKDDIYLHDSPARSLFARDRRAFSHGCVRVDQPLELAAWLLEDQPTWTRAKITTAMVAATPSSVRLRHKVPVVLYYATATVDPDGTVRFAGDPYGLDATLRRALDAPASE
jgi:murein L,D-transpeptidase YcbB/YkuD